MKRYQNLVAIFQLTSLILTAKAVATTYEYDKLSRLTKVVYSNGKTIRYTYDAAGNRLSRRAVSLTPGDANGDDRVTFEDFSILQNNYGQSGKTWTQGDFNGDGRVTFEDFSILQNNYGRIQRIPGDANGDGRVTFEDFSILQNNYGQSGKQWADGDFNGDGRVTFEDFSILQNHYGQTAGAAGQASAAAETDNVLATPIPCAPLGVILLLLAGLGMIWMFHTETAEGAEQQSLFK